jgi:hypothetical protein
VIGLAFAGLSSTTLAMFAHVSTWATLAVIAGMGAGVVYLAWCVGSTPPHPALSLSGGRAAL